MKDALLSAMTKTENQMLKNFKALAPGQRKIYKAWVQEKLANDEWEESPAPAKAPAGTSAAAPAN